MDLKICFLITIFPTGSTGLFDSNSLQLERSADLLWMKLHPVVYAQDFVS